MTFANLWAFWFLAISVPVIALYFFRIRRRRQDVPNLAIWRAILQEKTTTFLLKRLRRILSLLLQLLIMTLIVLALAKPVMSMFFSRDLYVVLVLDCSASMQAVEKTGAGSETRFDAAVRAAEGILKNKPDRTQVMIVSADRDLNILCPFSDDARVLLERLEKAEPTLYPTDLRKACRLAADVLRGRKRARVILLSDGTGPPEGSLRRMLAVPGGGDRRTAGRAHAGARPAREPGGAGVELTCLFFGRTDDNVGIVNFSARKNEVQKTDEVLVVVKNFSGRERSVSLEYYEEGRLRKNIPLELGPHQEIERILATSLPSGGVLALKVTPADAFPPDNAAYAVVRPEKRFRVLLVSPAADSFFYVKAFNAMEEAIHEDSLILTPEEYAASAAARAGPDPIAAFDLVIFNNCDPPGELPDGSYLLVNCDAPGFVPTRGVLGRQTVSGWNRRHPINRYVSYHNVTVAEARQIPLEDGTPTEGALDVLLRSAETPLAVVRDTGRHRIVYVGFDVQRTALPFRIAFPAMLRNVLSWSHSREADLFLSQYGTGEIIRPLHPVPAGLGSTATLTLLVGSEEKEHHVPIDGRGLFSFARTDDVAPCRIEIGERTYFTSINLSAPGESAIGPASEKDGPTEAGAPGVTRGFELRSLLSSATFWKLLTGLAVSVLLLEWLLFHRRSTE